MDIFGCHSHHSRSQLYDYICLNQESNSYEQPASIFQLYAEPQPSHNSPLDSIFKIKGDLLDYFILDPKMSQIQNQQTIQEIQVQPTQQFPSKLRLQKLYTKTEKESSIKDKKKLNRYYLGHIDYETPSTWLIFGLSRKYERTKKRRHSNSNSQFKAMAKRMNALKKNAYDVDFAKRFDQELNESFRALPLEDQQYGDITPSALRNIMENKEVGDNAATLDKFITSYESKRHWINFLNNFIHQKPQEGKVNNDNLFS